MSSQKLRIIFCLLLTVFLSDALTVGNQDLTEYFAPIPLDELRWAHVKTIEDFNSTIENNDVHILVLDVEKNGTACGLKLNEIIGIYVEIQKSSSKNKKAFVYNMNSDEAFENILADHVKNCSSTAPPVRKNLERASLDPFPQWFNIKNDLLSGVIKFYKKCKGVFDAYTFSFETNQKPWPTDTIETINDEFKDVNKHFFISSKNDKLGCDSDSRSNNLITVRHDPTKEIKCTSDIISAVTEKCPEKYLIDMQPNLKFHARMCLKHKPLLTEDRKLGKKGTTWRLIDTFSNLNEDIEEDIIKVNVDGEDLETSYLGESFETFITQFAKIAESAPTKGLQLYFRNKQVLDAFVNMDNVSFIKAIDQDLKIGLKFDETLWTNASQDKQSYFTKILSCYSVSLGAEDGFGPYTTDEMDNLKTIMDHIQTVKHPACQETNRAGSDDKIMLSLDLKRISTTENVFEKIRELYSGFEISLIDTTKTMEKEDSRNFLRQLGMESLNLYFEYDLDDQKAVRQNVLMTDLIPGLSTDLKQMNFAIVRSRSDLSKALDDENKMLELNVKTDCDSRGTCKIIAGDDIDFCTLLGNVGVNNKNGIKLHFKKKDVLNLTLQEKCFMFLNFPVWLELLVAESKDRSDNVIDLTQTEDEDMVNIKSLLEEHGYKIILRSNKLNTTEDAKELIEQRTAILLSSDDVGFYINAGDLANNGDIVNTVFKKFKAEMVLVQMADDEFIAKQLRNNIPDKVDYYANMEDKFLLEECPSIESNGISADDFRDLKIADFISGDQDELIRIVEHFDMIRVNVTYWGEALRVDQWHSMTLKRFLEIFDTAVLETSKTGIIFTFEESIVYKKAMREPEMKAFNHPIWFDLKVISSSPPFENEVIDLDYMKFNDKIDCRTLSLGIATNATYTQNSIEQLIVAGNDKGNARVYAFDFKYLKNWEKDVNNVKNVLIKGDKDVPFNTSKFRDDLAKLTKKDIAFNFGGSRTFATLDCPKNNDVFDYFNGALTRDDVSSFTLSNYINSLDDIEKALNAENHMLNVLLTVKNKQVVVSDKLVLLELLENIEKLRAEQRIGLKLEFTTTESFEMAVNDPLILYYIKTIERPIWISAKVLGQNNVELSHDFNNDILDCRTLSLGWTGNGTTKYSKENLEAMSKLKLGTNNKYYTVDMIHLMQNFENIEAILLTKSSSKTGSNKPPKKETREPNGNMLMVALNSNEVSRLETAGLGDFLDKHKHLFFFDMTYEVKSSLFTSGVEALGSGVFVILVCYLGLLIFNY